MKKLISIIIVVFLFTNCQESNPVNSLLDIPEENSTLVQENVITLDPKTKDPATEKIAEVSVETTLPFQGSAKFIPGDGVGGFMKDNEVYYPASIVINNQKHRVYIIRQIALSSKDLGISGKSSGTFKIVEANGTLLPSLNQTVLFKGKFKGHESNTLSASVYQYFGKGVDLYKGSELNARERITISKPRSDDLVVNRTLSSHKFVSKMSGKVTQPEHDEM